MKALKEKDEKIDELSGQVDDLEGTVDNLKQELAKLEKNKNQSEDDSQSDHETNEKNRVQAVSSSFKDMDSKKSCENNREHEKRFRYPCFETNVK
ncbi:hypothetical protein RWE15_21070 [Virgibacillus halophilus]|uniref:Uncharacterized protein n=1 Tax=Tigheibacillus halophilus TaxID=361280 RepID=A0ABU5CAJ3_9BACI|nr:hypothetical protein [Virgibacillus halophilus]